MTLFTSLLPSVHGVGTVQKLSSLPSGARTLAEILRAHGLETGAVTENAAISLGHGFERGFSTYQENTSSDLRRTVGHIEKTLNAGRDWLLRHRDKRFFLFLHTYQVHSPNTPPPAYAHFFPDELPRPNVS